MATYALTVSTNALGLGVINGATVRIEKRRIAIADTYPPINNLIQITQATNSSGIATFLLQPDDLTTYHVAKIFDTAGIFIYERFFSMPPSETSLEDTTTGVLFGNSNIQFKDEGDNRGTPSSVRNVDFVGAGVEATFEGDTLRVFVQSGSDLALGETITTAYRGDRGKTAYEHSQATGNPHSATTADINDSTDKRYVTDVQRTRVNTAASSGADGYLTSTDWTTFNGKQAALADVITANTYGSGSKIPRATYNAKGIVTGITEVDLVAGITPVAYTAGTAYTVGQVVSFADNLYRVVTAHTASTTPNGNIDLIGDVCKVNAGSSFTAYRLSNLPNPAANKTLEVWGSGTTFTLDLVNAPSKVIFRAVNAYNVMTLTIHRAGSTFYHNKSGTAIGSNSYSLNVVGGCTLEITVYTSEVSVHVIQQPTIQEFKLVDTTTAGTANVGVSFAGNISTDVEYTLANKAINFGDLPNVATTNSNNLSGTRNRILGGYNNTVSGTDNITIGGIGNNVSGSRATLINCNTVVSLSNDIIVLNARSPNTTSLEANCILLGTSKQTDLLKNMGTAASLRLNALYALSSAIPISGTLYATIDGSQTLSASNLVLGVNDTGACATHEVEFIVCAGTATELGSVLPTGYFIAKRRIVVFRHAPSGTFYVSAVQTIGTDVTLGTLGGTITPDLSIDTTTGSATICKLLCKIDRTGGVAGQEVVAMSVRVASHHSR